MGLGGLVVVEVLGEIRRDLSQVAVLPPITPEGPKRTGPGAAAVHSLPQALEALHPTAGSERGQVRHQRLTSKASAPPQPTPKVVPGRSSGSYLFIKFHVPTWGYPEVGGNSEGVCPSGQQDRLVAGLQNDGHTQIHASIRGQLGPRRPGLPLVQGRKRAERGSLAGGSRLG